MIAGVCKYCGCTQDRACPEGCGWVDDGATVCTTCSRLMTDEELIRAASQDGAVFTEDHGHFELPLPIDQMLTLTGLVQLALRHPHLQANKGRSHEFGAAFIAGLIEQLEDYPALQEMVRRGGDPKHDVHLPGPPQPPSNIIVP